MYEIISVTCDLHIQSIGVHCHIFHGTIVQVLFQSLIVAATVPPSRLGAKKCPVSACAQHLSLGVFLQSVVVIPSLEVLAEPCVRISGMRVDAPSLSSFDTLQCPRAIMEVFSVDRFEINSLHHHLCKWPLWQFWPSMLTFCWLAQPTTFGVWDNHFIHHRGATPPDLGRTICGDFQSLRSEPPMSYDRNFFK